MTGHEPKGIKPCIGYIYNEDKGDCFLKTELTEMRNSGNVKAYAEFVSEHREERRKITNICALPLLLFFG